MRNWKPVPTPQAQSSWSINLYHPHLVDRAISYETSQLLKPAAGYDRLNEDMSFKFQGPGQEESCDRLIELLKEYDKKTCGKWTEEIDTLLVFAGLFSAVVTAFAVASFVWLQLKKPDDAVRILLQISQQIQAINPGTTPNATMIPPLEADSPIDYVTARHVNALWFSSLSLALTAALLGILCKQWVRLYPLTSNLDSLKAFSIRQMRREGLASYGVPATIASISTFLEISVVLFFIGLARFTWSLDRMVGFPVLVITSLVGIFLIATTITPFIQYIYVTLRRSFDPLPAQCPWKSPQSWLLIKAWNLGLRTIGAIVGYKIFQRRSDLNERQEYLHPPLVYVAPHLGGLNVYEHYLERCGDIPITVKIEIPYKERPLIFDCDANFPYGETYDYHIDLVSAVYQNCARWKVVELCMNPEDTNLLRFAPPDLEFPLLESLTLVKEGPTHFVQRDLFGEAPFLTSFTLLDCEGKTMDLNWVANALPWRHIRQFCTQAYEDNLRHSNNEFADGNNRILVLRPYLHDLHLQFDVPLSLHVSALVLDSVIWTSSLTDFFQLITIPTLESLALLPPDPDEIRRYFNPAEWTNPFSDLPEFLGRSGCALQTFTVIMRGRYVDSYARGFFVFASGLADSLVVALHSMKDLRTLRVIEAESGPPLFNERLFQEMALGHILPELTSLEMVWAEERQPVDALIPMLTSRGGQGGAGMGTLSSVVLGIRNGGDLRGDVVNSMANLRQQGIRATLW